MALGRECQQVAVNLSQLSPPENLHTSELSVARVSTQPMCFLWHDQGHSIKGEVGGSSRVKLANMTQHVSGKDERNNRLPVIKNAVASARKPPHGGLNPNWPITETSAETAVLNGDALSKVFYLV